MKGATYREYSKKTKLMMKEDLIEGKGVERLYEINIIDAAEESSEGGNWMKEIMDFLQESILPKDITKAKKIRMKTARYTIMRGVLYRKSFSNPLLRYLTKNESIRVLNTIHSRVCGNHSGGKSLAHKAITVGYF